MLGRFWVCADPAHYRVSGALLAGEVLGFKVDRAHGSQGRGFWQVNQRRAEWNQWPSELQTATPTAVRHAKWARFWFDLLRWAEAVVRVCW